ncbi:MAG: endopeptidase La [Bacteroidales bacterium]|nr:endopeptidase La [Bacteroidales bacterium]
MSDNKKIVSTTIMPLFPEGGSDFSFDSAKCNVEALPLIPTRDVCLFPGMTCNITVGRQFSAKVATDAEKNHNYIGVIMQSRSSVEQPEADDLHPYGCVAEVVKRLEMPDGTCSVIVMGRRIFKLESLLGTDPIYLGQVSLVEEIVPRRTDREMRALIQTIKDYVNDLISIVDNGHAEVQFGLNNFKEYNFLVNFLSSTLPFTPEIRQTLLEKFDLKERAETLARYVSRELEFARVRANVVEKTQYNLSRMQKEHFLHTQISMIQEELGEGSTKEVDRLRRKLNYKTLPYQARETFERELAKLQRLPDQSPEYGMVLTYLNTFTDLPWGLHSTDNLRLDRAKRILDRDHYGLDKVKERILEHLAVLKMRGDMKSPILCLYGPPGVGKTSLGKSIADALNRRYVRVSLGGLHDESEIRGHRKTYVGAMPGRIISGLIKGLSDNPVFVLDEIDKISNDFHGDPASALLEVLDPEQNTTFHDNYLDVDYDLSKVMFIATANDLGAIAPPLRDRMEIIDLSGYVLEEKVEIGVRHLLPKQKNENGLKEVKFNIPRKTMAAIVEQYTRESGVRLLDKRIAKIMRKVAVRVANGEEFPASLKPEHLIDFLGAPEHDPDQYEGNEYAGVVTGLAWTSVGGCTLMVESALTKGKGEKLTLTGNLGDVMKESAMIALQWIRANADYLEIPEDVFNNYNVHIHCPEGAIPKDGPSAGITMVTSLASTFTQRKVRARIAMTGEITLRGRVLPIGGVKEKLLAAKRAGITDLLFCIDNKKDVDEIKPDYRQGVNIHYVRDLKEVLEFALLPEKVKNPKKFY